jgi:hypothetical protein
LLNSEAGILLNLAVFKVLDPCGVGSSGFLFTEHLVFWCNKILSIEKQETLAYGGKNLTGKMFFLRVIENSSSRNSGCGRNITSKRWKFVPVTRIHFKLWKI